MSLVSRTIEGLYNGVSQQPATTRLDSQCELQENIMSSILDGITQRPPTEFTSLLASSKANENSLIHKINRDENEKYIVIFTGDYEEPLEVYTLEGTKCAVEFGLFIIDMDTGGQLPSVYDSRDYIRVSNPLSTLKAISVADYSFILNKDLTATITPTVEIPPTPTALIYVKKGVASVDYKIFIDGVQKAIYTSTDEAPSYKTDSIATDLYNDLKASLGETDWDIGIIDSVIYFSKKDGTDFDLRVSDSWGEQALLGIKNTIQKFTDLPPKAPEGYRVEITGDGTNSFDNYYVKFIDGVWKETFKSGLQNNIDPTKLPHKLVRTDYNTFTLSTIEWEPRTVGDEVSSPNPSFIGNRINDIFFYKNRLGFLANDSIIMSRAGSYFNFFPTTATDILDDDPIDISVSTNQVNVLRNALPGYNTNLLVDSGNQQFLVTSGDNLFTSKSVSVEPATSFETDTRCQPILAGTNAYFVTSNGNYSNIREYFLQPDTLINDAANITAHCPNYLPKNVIKLESSSSMDIILALSKEDRKTLYVYKYYWVGTEKVQSSWSKWIFTEDIYGIAIYENYLYMIQKNHENQIILSKLNLSKSESGTLGFKIRLDNQVQLQGVFDQARNKTVWTLPFNSPIDSNFIVVNFNGNKISPVELTSSNRLEAPGDYSSAPCWIGNPYTSRYRFSSFYIKNQDGGVANLNYKLQLRKLIISFVDTGYFRLEVTPMRRETIVSEVINTIIGVSQIGVLNLLSDKKDFLVMSSSKDTTIDIVSDSYLPFVIQSVTWQGILVSLSRGI